MNNATRFAALAFTALAMSAGHAQTTNGEGTQATPFQSQRSRAEVHAEAVQAARQAFNGEVGEASVAVTAPAASALTRAEVRLQARQAARQVHNGEATM